MYVPYAQGTIRPLSERLPFLVSWHLFGADCVPLRIFVFLTAAADLTLIAILGRRLSGSQLAGTAAALIWSASASLMVAMTWNSAYNEVQYPLFLLGALLLFIRYAATGERRFWWWQLAVFAIGFGSLENNVVYPGIAVAWTLLVETRAKWKRLLASTIPLFALSAAYSALHLWIAPAPKTGIYAVRVDARIFATLWEYWRWAFVSPEWVAHGFARSQARVVLVITMAAVAGFVAWRAYRRRPAALFGVAWFAIVISPLALLPDRHTEYYLCAPVIGLALAAGWAFSAAWERGWALRVGAMAIAGAWLAGSIPAARVSARVFADDSTISKNLVLGVVEAHRRHPAKAILLDGVPQAGYDAVVYEGGFRTFEVPDVYLAPDERKIIQPEENDVTYDGAFVDPAVVRHALSEQAALVYDFSPGHLKNVTKWYADSAAAYFPDSAPAWVQVGNPLYGYLLGPEWYPTGNAVRWMPGRATLRLAGPRSAAAHIVITGYCWDQQLARGPVHIAVSADGVDLGSAEMRGPEIRFEKSFGLAPELIGRKSMNVELRAWPLTSVGGRNYGVMVESVEIR